MLDTPSISVVVIGRNEGQRLVRCLESVTAMRHGGRAPEIIYVDSASSDGSVERAARLGAKVISVAPERPSAAAGRNAGWRAARGAIVLFLDGDMTVMPDFVESTISEFSDPQVGVLFGDCRESNPQGSIYNRILDLDWIVPVGSVEYCGGAALIRRDLLERVGGYNENLIAAEDTELCSRLRAIGYTVLHVDRLMVRHDLAITRFSQYWRRALRSGYAYAEVSERIRRSDLPDWYRQARRNRVQGAMMAAILVGAPIFAVSARSFAPLLIAAAIIAALAVRTALRSHWKKAPLSTRLVHGLHSHLVQIPLLFGQLRYQLDRFGGRTAELIEYKDGSAPVSTKVKSA
jgi:cellulose synthase/poly-beta-1,6-N-acetylglucosamine synthase-like glycosyltransferase